MPATVLPSTKRNAKAAQKLNGHHKSKKTRLVRRRGRGRDAIDSDDELEREARSDSGSDDEDNTSSGSDSDDDGLSGSANHTKDTVVTPSTTQSPPPDDKPLSNGDIAHDPEPATEPSAYKDGSSYWDAFGDEDPWGPAPAEVTFDNHDQLVGETKPRRKNRNKKKKQQASSDAGNSDTADADPEASSSHRETGLPTRGRSVRETYRNRLQDPSYVPTVGEFWGHDDRLLDKELRSLSGWWRGRWHKGRGGYSGRGRGVYHGGGGFDGDQLQEETNTHPSEQQTWGHDGFEEMKKKEEQRRLAREQRQKEQREAPATRGTPFQRGSTRGGRGGLVGTRGRGYSRGGFSPSSPRPSHPIDRPWYAQKPERVWTKQLDGFLHFNSTLKPKLGQGQGYRVKLAGPSKEKVVRVSPEVHATQTMDRTNPTAAATDNVSSPAVENKTVTVRLPTLKEKDKSPEAPPAPIPEPTPVEVETASASASLPADTEESLDEVFTVKPRPVPAPSILTIVPPPTVEDPAASQLRSEFVERAVVKQSPSQSVDGGDTKGAPQSPEESQRPAPPVLHPIRTVFTPVAPQPQTYAAPYQYPPHLPPGITINSHGIMYEIATGRPVYLQSTPPPMYDPRPVMPPIHPGAVPFVPGHMHHLSGHSADFTNSRSHSMSSYDPVTGMALFSPPRQNSRIEIRRPGEANLTSPPMAAQTHRPSGLRTTVSAQDDNSESRESQTQTQQPEQPSDYYPSIADQHPGGGHTSPPPHVDPRSGNGMQHPGLNPNVMAYQPQPYPYYGYPDYGYPQYMDMSQMGYEMYPDPHHNPQAGIYY
ncbi:hypothetical protein BDM02DRAFT_3110210 [Thelephora ganbajun]|uniref:Uncharacterized protein n=1 Tax=Thelephora ganbajun TaxID=370292 RepID=A0ACB6ZQ36_THEGA|nr:hypothetical protein BDM02DRAFT_3110210 [Thelephora ganbajun]